MEQQAVSETCKVCVSGDDAFIDVDGGRGPIQVLPSTEARSGLFRELRDLLPEVTSTATLPIPLSFEEITAWLQIAQPATGSAVSDVDAEACSLPRGDDTLLHALKAAMFLQDNATAMHVARALAKAMLPAGAGGGAPVAPTKADRERAEKILASVPQDAVPNILAAALRHMHISAARRRARVGPPVHPCSAAHALLELLPTTFHAAVMQALCDATGNGDTLAVHDLPLQTGTARAALSLGIDDEGSSERRQGRRGARDDIRHVHPAATADSDPESATFRLLAAAAPLAGAAGRLAALHVKLSTGCSGGEPPEPPRWCSALAQLRSLRRLTVAVPAVDGLSVPQFVVALSQLSHLDALRIGCGRIRVWRDMSRAQYALPFCSCAVMDLLRGICRLRQLSALSLQGRQHAEEDPHGRIGFAAPEPDSGPADETIRGISRLTQLTSMRFQCHVFGQRGTSVVVRTLAEMPSLREVHAELLPCSATEIVQSGWRESVCDVVDMLCKKSAMASVRSFGICGVKLALTPVARLSRLQQRIHTEHPALLTQLTSLHLPGTLYARDSEACAALLCSTPALRSLCLAGNRILDDGLRAVAGVLPRLPCLTSLDVSCNGAADEGVFAVLDAVVAAEGGRPGAPLRASLRGLNISGSAVSCDRDEHLGALLRQMPALESCGIPDLYMGLGGNEAGALGGALGALPRLRFLYKGCHVEQEDVAAYAMVQESLTAALEMLHGERDYWDRLEFEHTNGSLADVRRAVVSTTWPLAHAYVQ